MQERAVSTCGERLWSAAAVKEGWGEEGCGGHGVRTCCQEPLLNCRDRRDSTPRAAARSSRSGEGRIPCTAKGSLIANSMLNMSYVRCLAIDRTVMETAIRSTPFHGSSED